MKHIKKFNELRHYVYYNAARKLEKDHPTRAKKMLDWSGIVKNKEDMKRWEEDIERYSPFGTFKVKLFNVGDKTLLIDDYYLEIDFDDDYEVVSNEKLFFRLDLSLIPTDMESFDKLSKIDFEDYGAGYRRHIGVLYFIINLKTNTYDSITIEYEQSCNIYANSLLVDRKSAVKFKRLLVDIFTTKNYPVASWDKAKYSSLYDKIDLSLAETGVSSDYVITLNDLAEKVNSIPVNNWYKSE